MPKDKPTKSTSKSSKAKDESREKSKSPGRVVKKNAAETGSSGDKGSTGTDSTGGKKRA